MPLFDHGNYDFDYDDKDDDDDDDKLIIRRKRGSV